ncbi:hypothetical protein L1987_04133 [Smallanthus sonchifolius]|uniref:Uncharacterized protein n=1 Tax=Smallanthus sonchifolius TaxID=185202 RepID=A0ACB9KCI6_9ASTR|nr:hypothetical protein L1987_04133 [Smallanthus sonchifolius]
MYNASFSTQISSGVILDAARLRADDVEYGYRTGTPTYPCGRMMGGMIKSSILWKSMVDVKLHRSMYNLKS